MAKKAKTTTPKAETKPETKAASRYIVKCDCPTPLASNPFTTLAGNETEAVKRFKSANGISGTDHEITVVEASA